jgi:predicted solute-binding protein
VYGLDVQSDFDVRFDTPSECARLLHAHETDVGLIPSIEFLRGPQQYAFVPGPAITSRGPVASVAIYTRRDPRDIRTIAMDTSSRTSVALAAIVLRRRYGVTAESVPMRPDVNAMLASADAALIIGDTALFLDHTSAGAHKIDLGEAWDAMTGLPFVYAVWAGWPQAVTPEDAARLQQARDLGVEHSDDIARAYCKGDPAREAVAMRYLRDNIQYYFGWEEIEGLTAFYGYAAELGLASYDGQLRFYHAEHTGVR